MATNAPATLGFLAVVEHQLHGLFGGYLLLNTAGRPLEFHCTAPIKPNRAQQILYGPTLQPYLYGEYIGASLIRASQWSPLVLLVEHETALAVRAHIELPVAMVAPPQAPIEPRDTDRPLFHSTGDPLELTIGPNRLRVLRQFATDCQRIVERLAADDDWFDFLEPFQRIRGAIEEAQRSITNAA